MGEMQEKLQNWLTKDICLCYDDIVQALCERGPVFMYMGVRAEGSQSRMNTGLWCFYVKKN